MNLIVNELTARGVKAGLPHDHALELARNLAGVTALGPLSREEWLELVDDALRARSVERAGSAWRLSPDLRGPLRAALADPPT